MIRRPFLSALSALFAAFSLILTPAVSVGGVGSAIHPVPFEGSGAGERPLLVHDGEKTTLHYDSSLTEVQVQRRVEGDLERLGLPLVKTLLAGRAVIVDVPREEVERALSAAEDMPITGLSSVYLHRGDPHPSSMIAFTGRVALEFAAGVSEAEKAAFLGAQGFTRVRENAAGTVVVETNLEPGAHMMDVAGILSGQEGWIGTAHAEFLATAELSSINSTSIQIDDDLFIHQWYHFNSPVNTNFMAGRPNQDLNTPRAWQINQMNQNFFPGQTARGTFGHTTIIVGLFDNGVQVNHEDLAESIDARMGIDLVDGGTPLPTLGALGAHGTAMAGLISGQVNGVGIAGVAPGTTLYPVRVVRPDNSVSNVALLQALQDSVFKGVSVNVHPYVLPFDSASDLANATEQGLRETFESGRGGVGIANFAAAGNFWSQVEYPGHSRWTISVGGHGSSGSNTFQANWGGLGVDITMPTYAMLPNESINFSETGIVTTDLQGTPGISGPNPFVPGMESGNYAVIGDIDALGTSSGLLADLYQGTSVATALAGGVAALMLADERFNQLPPLAPNVRQTRQQTRDRAPVWPNDSTLYSKLVRYADLPPGAPPLAYFDQYHERLGHGRPNPARFLAATNRSAGDTPTGEPDGWVSPDSGFLGQLSPDPVYVAEFAFEAPLDYLDVEVEPEDPDDPESVAEAEAQQEAIIAERTFELTQGWEPDPGANLTAFLSDDIGTVTVSPALVPVGQLIYEDNGMVTPDPPEPTEEEPEPPPNFFWVWMDSLPFADEDSDDIDVAENMVHNPDGRYHRNATIRLLSPEFPYTGERTPMMVTVRLAHELGVESSHTVTQDGDPTIVRNDIDEIQLEATFFHDEGGDRTVVPAVITGDSSTQRKTRLQAATTIDIGDDFPILVPNWPALYNPLLPQSEMIIREYRFFVPAPSGEESTMRLALTLDPTSAFLPSWRMTDDGPEPIRNIFRNYRGYIFDSIRVDRFEPAYMEYLAKNNFDLMDGMFPVWSASQDNVLAVQPFDDGEFHVSTLVVADTHPRYLADRGSLAEVFRRPPIGLMESFDRVTGFKSNPLIEEILMTTIGPSGDHLYLINTDGAMQTRVIDSSLTEGARDPSWAINGRQILFSSDDYIRSVNLIADEDDPEVETVIQPGHPFLTEFRSPLYDRDAAVIIFAARRTDEDATDASLNLYVSSRVGRVVNFREDPRLPFLAGWEGIDMYDFDLTVSGRRLVFVANASAPPEIDEVDPNMVIAPATPSSGTSIFTVENFENVLRYGDPPVYSQIPLLPEDPDFSNSARWPRIAPNRQEIVYMAFRDPVNINQPIRNGRIVRQPIDIDQAFPPVGPVDPSPPPDVTPIPEPTPTPVDPGRVTFSGAYNFVDTRQGWTFVSAEPDRKAPIQQHRPNEGALTLRSNNSLNTFGFWKSPGAAIQAQEGSLFLYRARTRAMEGTPAQMLPTTRLRVNAGNLESAFTAETNSAGDLSLVPTAEQSRNLDLLFRAPRSVYPSGLLSARRYELAFDMINTLPDNDPNGGLILDGVEIYRLDEQAKYYSLFCFEVVTPNTDLTLTALGADGVRGGIDLSLRRCCNDPQTEEQCISGSAREGVTLNLAGLDAGYYTVVVAVDREQDVILEWNSSSPLSPSCDDGSCSPVKSDFEDSRTACEEERMPLGGTSGVEVHSTFHDGIGMFPTVQCTSRPNQSVIKARETFFEQSFDEPGARDIWFSGPEGSDFTLPQFGETADALTLTALDPGNTFGFWSTDGTTIPSGLEGVEELPAGPLIYRAHFRISNEQETNPFRVPDIRVRLGTNDNQRSVSGLLLSNLHGRTVPMPGRPREIEVYMVLEEVPESFDGLIAAVDVLSFFEERTLTTAPIKFEAIRIERLDIPNYPTAP